ncbi:MAG: hypothetical protein Q7U31_01975, partial [Anaerolineaceae bacterium]|nr:hypothetical protein [Anaerolineaceae bacterium]
MGSESELTGKPMAKRPFLLYLLAFIFLMAGMFSLVGTLGIFQSWSWWLSFVSVNSIVLQVFVGVLITFAWVSAAVILWLRFSWAVIYSSFVITLVTVWFWVERLLLTQNPMPFSRHALVLVIMCIFLIFVFSSLYLVAPAMKTYQNLKFSGDNSSVQTSGDKNE